MAQHQQRATMRREGYTNIIETAQGIECLTYRPWTVETKKVYELMLSIVAVCKTVFNFSLKWVHLFFMILTFLKSLKQQYFLIDLCVDRYCYECVAQPLYCLIVQSVYSDCLLSHSQTAFQWAAVSSADWKGQTEVWILTISTLLHKDFLCCRFNKLDDVCDIHQ